MNKHSLENIINTNFVQSTANIIQLEQALTLEMKGLVMYQQPLIGYASAQDNFFNELAQHDSFKGLYKLPDEWLPGAQTIISMFFPFTEQIKTSNAQDFSLPSTQWLHARIEGQMFIMGFTQIIMNKLVEQGYQALAPCLDKRFISLTDPEKISPQLANDYPHLSFTSNWSERHTAYAAGLGTFGLSKGLITVQGVAGRFTSIITNLHVTPTQRRYTSLDEYCSKCGVCALNCPIQAIDKISGKTHLPCSHYLDKILDKYRTHYGCGKCQVKVPCASCAPTLCP